MYNKYIEQKIIILAQREPCDEPIVLVDDRGYSHVYAELLKGQHQKEIQNLLKRLTIFSFGANETQLPSPDLCPLFALPTWSHLENVMTVSH